MQSPNRFYYTWRLLFLHHSFAWCFFFYLSFLFPPVEPGVFNCCVTKTQHRIEKSCGADYLFYKREHMNYIHVFLHIKSVASHASVYLMAAVIGTEAQQSFMPAPLRFYSVVYL